MRSWKSASKEFRAEHVLLVERVLMLVLFGRLH